MRVLFIGGTGNISRSCVEEALRRGHEVTLFHRGRSPLDAPARARSVAGDYSDPAATRRALEGQTYDVVAQFIGYRPEQVAADIDLFSGRVGQYVFISSTSVYHRPPSSPFITESTPLHNPFWQYAKDKIGCEELLRAAYRDRGFPATVVRPSHTYGESWIPTCFGSRDYTVAGRIIAGRPIVVHGDGTSLWGLTHADDFARCFVSLFGNPRALGEAYHITTDEVLTWNQIHEILAAALGKQARIVHVPSEAIAARFPDRGAGLVGDKAHSMIFDNGKVRKLVPGWVATIPYHEGIVRSLRWYDADPSRKTVNPVTDREIDALVDEWATRDSNL